jgi:hypothetical protein
MFSSVWKRRDQNCENGSLKSFYASLKDIPDYDLKSWGVRSIDTADIVGSVGRAEELDCNFRSRKEPWNDRHRLLEAMMRRGEPSEPIKVFLVRREKKAEYYVLDGHHRVALAKRNAFKELNADVTEVVLT